jgi:hypothetical protein
LIKKFPALLSYIVTAVIFCGKIAAQQSAEEVAKKLANPVAGMISVPFQNNTDYGIGDAKGIRNTMNLQPVVPIKLSKKLNLITRYIIPIVTQYHISSPDDKQNGLGDAVISAFFLRQTANLFGALARCSLFPSLPTICWEQKS